MDSIMQYTDGWLTAWATLLYAGTFLAGIWVAAKCGIRALFASIVIGLVGGYIRFALPAAPLSALALLTMAGLHLAAGVWLGLLLNRGKNSKAA